MISAAYRALIRHYHPDTNPDPEAQAKARAITAAYSVLRDPHKRADYDARRKADEDLWSEEERGEPVDPPRAPAMRGIGIALAVLAFALVVAVWAWPRTDRSTQPVGRPQLTQEPAPSAPLRSEPAVELQPESERLARLREEADAVSPPPLIAPAPEASIPADPILTKTANVEPAHIPAAAPRRAAGPTARTAAKRMAPPAPAPKNERLATLESMSSGFFIQSMAAAGNAKQDLLISARDRFAAQRKKCRSEACVADAYVRQIRETSAIMEGRTGPPK